jgi:preprotein translocase subunit SecD
MPMRPAMRLLSFLPAAAIILLAAGCASAPPAKTAPKSISFAIHTANDYETTGYNKTRLPSDNPRVRYDFVWVNPKIELDETDVDYAEVTHVHVGEKNAQREEAALALTMTSAGRGKLKALTGRRGYSRLVIFVNGKLIMAPYVQGRITDGKMLIYGTLDASEAGRLAAGLGGSRPEPQFNLPQ